MRIALFFCNKQEEDILTFRLSITHHTTRHHNHGSVDKRVVLDGACGNVYMPYSNFQFSLLSKTTKQQKQHQQENGDKVTGSKAE
jgi:hypothetical protein